MIRTDIVMWTVPSEQTTCIVNTFRETYWHKTLYISMSICHNSVKTGTGFLDKSFGQQKMQSMNGNNSHCSNEPELSLKEE